MTQAQQSGDDETEGPIHRNKKKTGEQDHEKDKDRRDHRFPARGPCHLGGLGAHFLKELQRVGHYRSDSSRGRRAIFDLRPARGDPSPRENMANGKWRR